MGSPSFTERPARKTRRRFSCCTDCPLRHECSSRCSPGFPAAIHLVAPDYPGFGHSDWPKKFPYAFDHIAEITNHFTEALGLSHFTLYMQDYGGPVGFRMALAHPDRIKALNLCRLRTNLLSLPTTRTRHVGNDPNVERYAPNLWTDEFCFLNQPGQDDIQSNLFYDYRTDLENYSKGQAWMREQQPPLLVIWGKYDLSSAGAALGTPAADH
jgi:pimeloyl-ACP methyl ester carboxylesterase